MTSIPHCPACGAPLPKSQSSNGVTCEYCGIFIRTTPVSLPSSQASTNTDQQNSHDAEFLYPEYETSPFETEIGWDSLPQWKTTGFHRWKTLRRSLLGSVLIFVLLFCFSCICLLSVIDKPLRQLFNSLTR